MSEPGPLKISTAPFLHEGLSTRQVMRDVAIALVPVVAAAVYYFGIGALATIAATCVGAFLTEWVFGSRKGLGTLGDYTALLTGVMLALTLPPSLPLWMCFLGGVTAIGLGKVIWGGMGKNLFNPALVGRAFLQAAFPTAMTTWSPNVSETLSAHPGLWAAPLMGSRVDAITSATPLGLAKFESEITDSLSLLLGSTAGSLGETAGVIIVVVGLWLGFRRVFDWRLPVSTLLSVAAFAGIFYGLNRAGVLVDRTYPDPLFMLLSGGLMFAAVFMVTDPVTTPLSPRGSWIFGIGVGALVVVIRLFGGLPEGVMYAILLMNAITPLIDRKLQPRRFGG